MAPVNVVLGLQINKQTQPVDATPQMVAENANWKFASHNCSLKHRRNNISHGANTRACMHSMHAD